MLKASDFDRNMLLLATQISHQSEMKSVLLLVLEALLKTLKLDSSSETVVEAMTLIRCIIRLALGLLVDPTANKLVKNHFTAGSSHHTLWVISRTTLIDTVLNHFRTGKRIFQKPRNFPHSGKN